MEKFSLKIFPVAILLIVGLSSCKKSEVNKEVYIDSYVHSIFDRTGVPVYNVMHTAYSFTKLSAVSVTGSSGTTITLDNFSNGYSFYNPVGDSTAYKPVPPDPESFTYNITYDNGETATKTDATVAKYLLPAPQVKAKKDSSNIVLSWLQVANAEAYKVRIFSQDANADTNTLLYESDFFVPKDATVTPSIPFSLVGLSQYLTTDLSFEVSAFIFGQNKDTYQAVSDATFKGYFGN